MAVNTSGSGTDRHTWDPSSRGMLNYDMLDKLAKYPEALGKAIREIASDIAARAPHHIGKAVSTRYTIKTLSAIKRRSVGSESKFSERGDTSLKVSGDFENNFSLVFTGKVFSEWPTKANGRQTIPKLRKVRANKKLGIKEHKERPKYTVTRSVFRGKYTKLEANSSDNSVYAIKSQFSGQLVPMMRTKGRPKSLTIGATSIPQAIIQPETVKLWEQPMIDMIDKRIEHAVDRHLPK